MARAKSPKKIVLLDRLLGLLFFYLFIVLSIIGAGSVLLVAYYGVPIGDDYLAIKTLSNRHTWLHETWNILTNTSRYAQSLAATTLYGAFRERISIVLPLVVLAWFYSLFVLYFNLLRDRLQLKTNPLLSFIVSGVALTLFITLGSVNNPQNIWLLYQPFYNASAIVTHTLCLLSIATLGYLFIRYPNIIKANKPWGLIGFIAATFFVCLFNETIPATIFVFAATILILSYLPIDIFRKLRSSRRYLLVLMPIIALALVIMYFSPARIARSDATGGVEGAQLSEVVTSVIRKAAETASSYLAFSDLAIVFSLASFIYLAALRNNRLSRELYLRLSVLGVAFIFCSILALLTAIGLLVLGYGLNAGIFPRTFLVVHLMLFLGLIAIFLGMIGLFGDSAHSKRRTMASLVITFTSILLLSLSAPQFLRKVTGGLATVERYHSTWIQQDARLRDAALKKPVETIYLDESGAGIGDGFTFICNPLLSAGTSWLSDGMETYYGLKEICSTKDDPQNLNRTY